MDASSEFANYKTGFVKYFDLYHYAFMIAHGTHQAQPILLLNGNNYITFRSTKKV